MQNIYIMTLGVLVLRSTLLIWILLWNLFQFQTNSQSCYLIAQDESIAVSLLDLSPPHQYAAGGGGECWDIGGAAGGDCSRR